MEVIDKLIERIKEGGKSSSSTYLAVALASACSNKYKVSLLDASVRLDRESKELLKLLISIAQQPDYSNADQDAALDWLIQNNYIED
jgi:hypothetical protein